MGPIATDRIAGQWCAEVATSLFDGVAGTELRDALEVTVGELADLLTADDFRPADVGVVGTRLAELGLSGRQELSRLGRVVGSIVDQFASDGERVDARRVADVLGQLAAAQPSPTPPDIPLSTVFAHADIAVVLVDRDGMVVEANPAAERMGGYPAGMVGNHYLGHLSAHSAQGASQLFADVVEQRTATARIDVRTSIPGAQSRVVSCSLWPVRSTASGPVSHVIAVGEDITDRREMNEELRRLAMYDPLTGLPNRAHLTEYLADRVYPIRSDSVGAMLFCDLVGFKSINDTYGHAFGDTVLRGVAVRMRQAIGASDLLARLGGDEFVVAVSRPTSAPAIDALVARLHRCMSSPVLTPRGTPLRVRATIGFTLVHDDDRRQVETLMHDADVDMYRRRRSDVGGRWPVPPATVGTDIVDTDSGDLSFDVLPDSVFVIDERARIVGANRAACDSLGRPSSELLGTDIDDIYRHASGEDRRLSRVILTGVADAGNWARRRDDGATVVETIRVARADEARTTFYATARTAVEQPLDDGGVRGAPISGDLSVEVLQEILDSAPDLVFVKDRNGRYLFLNSAAAHVKGRPAAEVIGRDDTDFFPAEFASMLQRNDRSIMVGGEAVEFIEKPVVDGVARTFVSKKAPFRDASGRVAGIIGISRDVTAAWASEDDLRRTEARWQFAVDCSGDGIWDWDVQGGGVFYSPTWKSMLGYVDDEVGTDIAEWSDRIHPDDSDMCWARIAEHVRGDNGAFSFEHRLRANDGTWRYLRCRGRVIDRAADSSPLRIIATFSDVTAQRCSERDARRLAERLTLANHVSRIGVWECTDPITGVVEWDERMYKIYGHPAAFDRTLAGWQSLLHPDDKSSTLGSWRTVIAESEQVIVHNDFRIVRPDGQQRRVRSRAKIFRDGQGAAERIVGVTWDITDHD